MAALYATAQLVFAIAVLTFATLTGAALLAGVAPAVFMLSGSIAALIAGRAIDRYGRVPVLAMGFGIGVLFDRLGRGFHGDIKANRQGPLKWAASLNTMTRFCSSKKP